MCVFVCLCDQICPGDIVGLWGADFVLSPLPNKVSCRSYVLCIVVVFLMDMVFVLLWFNWIFSSSPLFQGPAISLYVGVLSPQPQLRLLTTSSTEDNTVKQLPMRFPSSSNGGIGYLGICTLPGSEMMVVFDDEQALLVHPVCIYCSIYMQCHQSSGKSLESVCYVYSEWQYFVSDLDSF